LIIASWGPELVLLIMIESSYGSEQTGFIIHCTSHIYQSSWLSFGWKVLSVLSSAAPEWQFWPFLSIRAESGRDRGRIFYSESACTLLQRVSSAFSLFRSVQFVTMAVFVRNYLLGCTTVTILLEVCRRVRSQVFLGSLHTHPQLERTHGGKISTEPPINRNMLFVSFIQILVNLIIIWERSLAFSSILSLNLLY